MRRTILCLALLAAPAFAADCTAWQHFPVGDLGNVSLCLSRWSYREPWRASMLLHNGTQMRILQSRIVTVQMRDPASKMAIDSPIALGGALPPGYRGNVELMPAKGDAGCTLALERLVVAFETAEGPEQFTAAGTGELLGWLDSGDCRRIRKRFEQRTR